MLAQSPVDALKVYHKMALKPPPPPPTTHFPSYRPPVIGPLPGCEQKNISDHKPPDIIPFEM